MTNKKYSARSMPVITRESYNVEKAPALPNWMSEFADNLQKQSVESKQKADKSIYDQISSIMGNKSRYPTVEAAVEDMKERSGMKKFLDKLQSQGQADGVNKKAEQSVKLFEKVPQLKDTADNYIEDTNGNLPIPAVVDKLKSIHRGDVVDDADWDDVNFLQYINNKSIEVRKQHLHEDHNFKNLGKLPTFTDEDIDPSNHDALHSLTPTVVSK